MSLLLAALLLLACDPGEATSPVELPAVVAEACGPYAADPELLPHCLTRQSSALSSVAEVHAVCSLAGAYEAECRQLWTQRQLGVAHRRDRSALLDACGRFPDCAFEVVDMWPADTVDQQLIDCGVAGPYVHSCVRHTLNRWLSTDPDAAEVVRLGSEGRPMGELVAEYLAVRVGCDDVGHCVETSPLGADCQRLADVFAQNPGRCPQNRGPRGPEGQARP